MRFARGRRAARVLSLSRPASLGAPAALAFLWRPAKWRSRREESGARNRERGREREHGRGCKTAHQMPRDAERDGHRVQRAQDAPRRGTQDTRDTTQDAMPGVARIQRYTRRPETQNTRRPATGTQNAPKHGASCVPYAGRDARHAHAAALDDAPGDGDDSGHVGDDSDDSETRNPRPLAPDNPIQSGAVQALDNDSDNGDTNPGSPINLLLQVKLWQRIHFIPGHTITTQGIETCHSRCLGQSPTPVAVTSPV
jgi:hypothetical protein